jgi:hypothetical protein
MIERLSPPIVTGDLAEAEVRGIGGAVGAMAAQSLSPSGLDYGAGHRSQMTSRRSAPAPA